MAGKLHTTIFFWDCECPDNYINSHYILSCQICGAQKDDQPDSRLSELGVDQLATINYRAERFQEEHTNG